MTGALSQPTIPQCNSGFVCVSVVNTTFIPIDIALYTHNGYDLTGTEYPAPASIQCCTGLSQVACPCIRAGATTGELELTLPELFQNKNLRSVQGQTVTTLDPQASLLEQIQCGQVKTLGVAVARETQVFTSPYLAGPRYRARIANPPRVRAGEVPCGGTIQFIIYDQQNNVNPLFATLAVRVVIQAPAS
jgi:hypothetical protein